jgi:hypothetical protein
MNFENDIRDNYAHNLPDTPKPHWQVTQFRGIWGASLHSAPCITWQMKRHCIPAMVVSYSTSIVSGPYLLW